MTADVQDIVVRMCPDCGSHLDDTWTGDECGRCGFAYVRVEHVGSEPSTAVTVVKRDLAGVCSLVAAMFSGIALATSSAVTAVETADGVAFSVGFDAAFWVATGFLFVAVLLVTYATQGGGRR